MSSSHPNDHLAPQAPRYLTPLVNIENYRRLLQQLKAIADPTRLHILLLLQQKEYLIDVQELETQLGRLSQPTVSHHLRLLRQAGLIGYEKRALYSYYYLRRDQFQEVIQVLTDLSQKHE